MKPIPDSLLLETAEIAATLPGLLLVAVFFYLETGFRRLTAIGPEARSFPAASPARFATLCGSNRGWRGPLWWAR